MARTVYTLEVSIVDGNMTEEFVRANPVVSRTFEIRADQTLNQLHRAIFEAFDRWDDCHLSEFHFGERPRDRHAARYVLPFIYDEPDEFEEPPPAGSTTRTRLGGLDLEVGRVFWYWYDFGDNWYHEVRVMAIEAADPTVKYPRVIARVGESPPQYVECEDVRGDEALPPGDWVAEVLEGHPTIGTVESGIIPIENDRFVAWIRRLISGEQTSLALHLTQQRTYCVTTLRGLADGNSELTTYIVPGADLDHWMNALIRDDDVTLLSVEAV